MGKTIRLEKITKHYDETVILKDIELAIEAGERIVLLGPSGSGKSTLLRMIAGLEAITSGELFLGERRANELESGQREIAMVFQNYALYPHMTVSENITFALKANKLAKKEIAARLNEALEMLSLEKYKDRLPRELSGGQRQRVALARAVVKRSDYFLLDEPLSNLDVRLRLDARKELVKIHERYQQTFIYVTHDQIEAMTLADRIVLLHEGKIQMVDTPQTIYARPNNVFTASFIGSPGMTILPVNHNQGTIHMANQRFLLNDLWREYLAADYEEQELLLGIRPEHLLVTQEEGELTGQIKYRELLGQYYALTVALKELEIIVLAESSRWQVGDQVNLKLNQQQLHFFDPHSQINVGYPEKLTKGE